MKMTTTRYPMFIAMALVFILFGCAEQGNRALPESTPVHAMGPEIVVDRWLLAGPFPYEYPVETRPDGSADSGFVRDFLADIGGETNATFALGLSIQSTDPEGKTHPIKVVEARAGVTGILDLAKLYDNAEYAAAYAFTTIRSSQEQEGYFLLGSDDAVKVWVNGSLVHQNYIFRALTPGDDRFPVTLKRGINTVLLKVANGVRGWGFSLSVMDMEKWLETTKKEEEQTLFMDFLNCKIVPDWYNAWDEYFYPGDFPEMVWDRPYLAKLVVGDAPLRIRWFDADLNEVKRAEQPGRYGYVAECTTLDGKPVRRAGTLYCWPWEWIGWSERPYARLKPLAAARLDPKVWQEHEDAIAYNVGRIALLSILTQQEGAALMSYLYELESGKYDHGALDNPLLIDDEYHIKLQKKIAGIRYNGPSLQRPGKNERGEAPVLRAGKPEEAGFAPDIIDELRQLCQEWFEVSGEPFVTLIARNGIVVYHEATGEDAGGVFTVETATPMASITKLITGVTFAQFVHQGLIQIDDPVGKYFPDFPLEGEKALTLRHCFTHTSGLTGHERWGGVHNHRLENVVASQLEFLPVGKKSTYNGDGYDLAGRVMEAVAGKSIFRIIHENLLEPLEMQHSSIDEDLAFSLHTTAGDIARVGQMLLNRGSYGKYEFFSPDVFDQILPKNLSQFYPGMDWDQGIGITWMTNRHPDAGKNGQPNDKTILSKHVIGHGSATSAVLRVDLDNGLVITQTRRRDGANYEKYLQQLLIAIEKNLK